MSASLIVCDWLVCCSRKKIAKQTQHATLMQMQGNKQKVQRQASMLPCLRHATTVVAQSVHDIFQRRVSGLRGERAHSPRCWGKRRCVLCCPMNVQIWY